MTLQLTVLQAIAIYRQHPCELQGTEGTTEGVCIHAMKLYYSNVHKVTNRVIYTTFTVSISKKANEKPPYLEKWYF